MGLAGLTIALQKAENFLNIPLHTSNILLIILSITFIVITLIFGIKVFKYPLETSMDLNHPVKLSFFPTFSISFLLLSVAFLEANSDISKYLWLTGTILHFLFTLKVIHTWINKTDLVIKLINPSWFIPVVGNIIVPVAGVAHFNKEISWFFFSIGLIFWLVLFTIIFYRIIFYEPVAEKLLPTFAILIAPPAVGMIAYFKLTGEIDNFTRILYYFAFFLTILTILQIKKFAKLKFYLSWWAYSFPLAAITIATIVMYQQTKLQVFELLGYILLILLINIILILLGKTIKAIFNNEICIQE